MTKYQYELAALILILFFLHLLGSTITVPEDSSILYSTICSSQAISSHFP